MCAAKVLFSLLRLPTFLTGVYVMRCQSQCEETMRDVNQGSNGIPRKEIEGRVEIRKLF